LRWDCVKRMYEGGMFLSTMYKCINHVSRWRVVGLWLERCDYNIALVLHKLEWVGISNLNGNCAEWRSLGSLSHRSGECPNRHLGELVVRVAVTCLQKMIQRRWLQQARQHTLKGWEYCNEVRWRSWWGGAEENLLLNTMVGSVASSKLYRILLRGTMLEKKISRSSTHLCKNMMRLKNG
jgi:hypothetical protein